CENLIWTDGWVWGSTICNVIQASSLFIPEQAIETPAGHSRHVAVTLRASFVSKLLSEVLHDAERVVPKRLDFNGLSSSGGDYPITDLRIHPRELDSLLAG